MENKSNEEIILLKELLNKYAYEFIDFLGDGNGFIIAESYDEAITKMSEYMTNIDYEIKSGQVIIREQTGLDDYISKDVFNFK